MASAGGPIGPARGVLHTGARWSRWIVGAATIGGVVLAGAPGAASGTALLVLAGAGLLAGLPHGSIDHRIAATLTGRPLPLVVGVYAGTAVATWVLLTVAGPPALVAVLALSLVHFGLGELESVRATSGWRPGRAVGAAVAVAGTGALLLPLARAGDQLAEVATSISPALGGALAQTPVRVALAAGWAIAAAVAITAAVRARRPGVVLDVLLVGALGALAPPLVAFAVWFGGWHAVRHGARLLTVEPRAARLLADGRPGRAVGVLLRLAAWPTVAAVVVLGALLVATASAADPVAAVGGTLLVLLALTVPHMIVVLWLDRRPAVSGPARP